MAIPPFWKNVPSRKLKRVIAREYNTSMRRNLKNWAADGESPAIQYVIEEIIIVGINRRGIKSKMKRESNHAVGL
jgi:formylmethanofuran:tetrahydromethanopterin formyltransferase